MNALEQPSSSVPSSSRTTELSDIFLQDQASSSSSSSHHILNSTSGETTTSTTRVYKSTKSKSKKSFRTSSSFGRAADSVHQGYQQQTSSSATTFVFMPGSSLSVEKENEQPIVDTSSLGSSSRKRSGHFEMSNRSSSRSSNLKLNSTKKKKQKTMKTLSSALDLQYQQSSRQ